MKKMKAEFPEIALWFTILSTFGVIVGTLFGFLSFIPLTEDCFCIPYLTRDFRTMIGGVGAGSCLRSTFLCIA